MTISPNQGTFQSSWINFDRDHIWHPYTSLVDPLPVYPVVSAKGVKLKLASGQELIDGMASWWTAIHGYNHPVLNQAAAAQLAKMSHVMFGGITHEPAIQLAQQLIDITPKGLEKIFFSDSGSVSVEVAMKMAIQYQHALGEVGRTKFLTIKKGYHGDTTAAMSVCDPISGMHHLFSSFLPKHYFCEAPALGFNRTCSQEELDKLDQFFEQYAQEAAAFILEPIIQGAGGMRIYSPDFLKAVQERCKAHKILLIADEIATGFGRTGKLFAVEQANIVPDILCLGKALTGGYLSLAATLCTTAVANTISSGEAKVMMHGPTFMGNPLACAIANASTKLLLASPWEERVSNIEKILQMELHQLIQHPAVEDVRILGAVGVIETKHGVNVAQAQRFFVDKGVWVRPFRNLLYIMPPYIISEADLRYLCQVLREAVDEKNTFQTKMDG